MGAARVIKHMDFRGGGVEIGDMEERPWRGASGLKESGEGLVIFFDRVVRERAVSGGIRQLSVCFSKIVILNEEV